MTGLALDRTRFRAARKAERAAGWRMLPAFRTTDDIDLVFLINKSDRTSLRIEEQAHLLCLLATYRPEVAA